MAGSIEKRGENSYRLTVSAGYDEKGKKLKHTSTVKVTGSTDTAKRKDAEKQLALFVAEIEKGQ